MKKKTRTKNIVKLMAGVVSFLLLLAVLPVQTAEAASATITISSEAEEIHAGDIVEVKLTISADATIGDFEAFLSYDDTIFEFYSAASCITGDAGSLRIYDRGASPSAQDRTYRIYFNALTQGECEVALYGRPMIYCYTDGMEMSVTGVSKTFTVLPSALASDNSNLAALYLVNASGETVKLTPSFTTENQTYYGTVPYESEMVIVSAIASDASANVTVSGSNELELGNNEVLITVTAEDGSKKEYKVYVYRTEFAKEPEAAPVPDNVGKLPSTGITFEEEDGQVRISEYHTYTVCEKPEELMLPDGYVQTYLMLSEIQVPAYVKQGEAPEEFLLLVLKNDAGDVNWYRYDRIEQTLQRVNEEEYVVTQVIQSNDESLKEAIKEYEFHQSLLTFTVALLFGICFVLLMVVVWLCIRRKNRG